MFSTHYGRIQFVACTKRNYTDVCDFCLKEAPISDLMYMIETDEFSELGDKWHERTLWFCDKCRQKLISVLVDREEEE